MLFTKKGQASAHVREEKSLHPVVHVADSLKEYQRELAKKEVASLWELSQVGASFSSVLNEGDQFQAKLQDLGQSFSNINETAGQFSQVRGDVGRAVTRARGQMEELGQTSTEVQQSYCAMAETFAQLEAAIRSIQQSMGKIVSIAEQTNILAINASIEAARAGEQGKGFAVVATEVKKLADEIKELIAEVESSVKAVEHGTDRLSDSIGSSRQALGESVQKVQETSEMFHQIIHAADGAANVQAEITQVLDTSKIALNSVCGFFDKIKDRYQEVVGHIERVSKLGTTKSAMFEDVDHMLSQIPPIVKE